MRWDAEIVRLAAESNALIITMTQKRADDLFYVAREIGKKVIHPIRASRSIRGRRVAAVLIEEDHRCVESVARGGEFWPELLSACPHGPIKFIEADNNGVRLIERPWRY